MTEKAQSKAKLFYGWWIVGAAFTTLLLTGGIISYTFGIFFKYLTSELNWSRAALSAAHTIRSIFLGLSGPIAGRAIDRYGVRAVMIAGAVLAGVCYLFLNRLGALWQFYLIYAFIGVAYASIGVLPAAAVVSRWFSRKRGLAMGMTIAGVGLGGAVMSPLSNYLISTLGWRTTYFLFALVFWLLLTPLLALVIRNKPEDMGLVPDGEVVEPGEKTLTPEAAPPDPEGLTPAEAIRTLRFWLIAFSYLAIGLGQVWLIIHLVPCITDKGFSPALAASIQGITVLCSTPARYGFGFLADRLGKRQLVMVDNLLLAIGMLILLGTTSTEMLFIFAVVFGLGIGGIVVLMSLMVGEAFGVTSFGEIFGYMRLAWMIGNGVSPFLAGYIFDVTQGYFWAFIAGVGLIALATIAIFFTRGSPMQERH